MSLSTLLDSSHSGLSLIVCLIGVMWLIHFINQALNQRLNILGIYPRSVWGLLGIVCSPFLHGSSEHLFFNTIPLFILGNMVILQGKYAFLGVSVSIMLLGGAAVWLFGRKALHLGASGLIMGYWSYLLMRAYEQPTLSSILLAVVCLYYLGGLFGSLFPSDRGVSFEGHLFGFLAGVISALFLPQILNLILK